MQHVREVAAYTENPSGRLVKVTHWWLEERAAHAFEALRNAFQETVAPGTKFVIVSAGRTHAEQVALKKKKPKYAATPGYSFHEAGLAIDITMRRVLPAFGGSQAKFEAWAATFGWRRTVKKENWHFMYWPDYPKPHDVRQAIRYIGNDA